MPREEKKLVLGQFFTKKDVVSRVIDLLSTYTSYHQDITILEPSVGTGNFIWGLQQAGFHHIHGIELDPALTNNPEDFFQHPLDRKYSLIIGNPPFSKYNLAESYYFPDKYASSPVSPATYLPKAISKKEKEKIENVFLLKSIQHLKDKESTIAFVLPISFFIKNKNKAIKQQLATQFSTIIIYQNDKIWFDYHIPCCFAIFTNDQKHQNEIIITYENGQRHEEIYPLDNIHEELIPETIIKKKTLDNSKGTFLHKILSRKKTSYNKSFKENNISAKNILEKQTIPPHTQVSDYKLAIVRVGNSSVGKCGLINNKKDVLNDMFYVMDFTEAVQHDKQQKEAICAAINQRQSYFQDITCRVGSKSIKKEDILNCKVSI